MQAASCLLLHILEGGRKEGRGEYGISSKGLSPGRTTSAALFRGPGNEHQPSRLAYKADDYDYEYTAALEALEMTRRDTSQAAKACERGHKTGAAPHGWPLGHWPSQVWLGWKPDRRTVRSTRNTKRQQARGALWLARALNRRTPCSQSPEGGETCGGVGGGCLHPAHHHEPAGATAHAWEAHQQAMPAGGGVVAACSVQGGWFRCVPLTLM